MSNIKMINTATNENLGIIEGFDKKKIKSEYKKARRCGIKVIAYEAGIHPSMIYKYMKNA